MLDRFASSLMRGVFRRRSCKAERGVASRRRGANRGTGGPGPGQALRPVPGHVATPIRFAQPEMTRRPGGRKSPRWSAEGRRPDRNGMCRVSLTRLSRLASAKEETRCAPPGAPPTPRSGVGNKRKGDIIRALRSRGQRKVLFEMERRRTRASVAKSMTDR
jgi:hypothetical protein